MSGSTLPFENAIYILQWRAHGLKRVHEQMAKNILQEIMLPTFLSVLVKSPAVFEYCNSLYSRQEVSSFCRTDDVLIGKGTFDSTFPSYGDKAVFTFNRCIFLNIVIHTKN